MTTTAFKRRQIFKTPENANIIIESLKWLSGNSLIELDTAVVMPDHLHFVAVLKKYGLPVIMKKLKGFTARQINARTGSTGPIWQPGYYDHAIRKDEILNDIRLYCLNNPVRAGIVENYQDYPFWLCEQVESDPLNVFE